MKPQSEPTKLEGKDRFHEYLAAGKLQGNKALITGGEYDDVPESIQLHPSRLTYLRSPLVQALGAPWPYSSPVKVPTLALCTSLKSRPMQRAPRRW